MTRRKRKSKSKSKSIIQLPKRVEVIDWAKLLQSLDKAKDLLSFWGLMYVSQYPSKSLQWKFFHMMSSAMAYKQLDSTVTGLQAQGFIAGELLNYSLKITAEGWQEK